LGDFYTLIKGLFQAGANKNFNKILIRVSQELWIEAFARHIKEKNPVFYTLEGGVSYPQNEIKTGIKIVESGTEEYQGYAYFEYDKKQSKIEFTAERSNSDVENYAFTISAFLPYWDPFVIKGKLSLTELKRNVDMMWKYGVNKYSVSMEQIRGTEQQLTGTLQLNNFEYYGNAIINETEEYKYISMELVGSRQFQLTSVIHKSHSGLIFDFFWDKSNDESKKISIRANAGNQSIVASIIILDTKGNFSASYSPSSLNLCAAWNNYFIQIELKFETDKRNFESLVSLQTSFECLSEIKLHCKLKYESDGDGSEIYAKVSNIYLGL
jgi:hypothetical protein